MTRKKMPGPKAGPKAAPASHSEFAQLLRAQTRELARRLNARGLWLGTAESCTGGLISALCTSLPGSSNWFRGAAVTYSNDLKTRLLGVTPDMLEEHGAVSLPVSGQMALGALELLQADLSVAVSGIAGPGGGSPQKPVGTVCISWACKGLNTAQTDATPKDAGPNKFDRLGLLAPEYYLPWPEGQFTVQYLPQGILLASRQCVFAPFALHGDYACDSPAISEQAGRGAVRLLTCASALAGLLGLLELPLGGLYQ